MRYFVYCRKSMESEDRQILSIDSQQEELDRAFSGRPEIEVVEVFKESYSAKAPGRPIFTEMLQRIENGEAEGIIAWHPDRLARNSVDGGRIIYLLDGGSLKDLRFANFSFENSSQGKFMLSIIFGYSKYYVDNLSENVKRGNRAKLNRGWLPNKAPIGYLNDRNTKTIVPDPDRFTLVQRLFNLALTEDYSLDGLRKQTVEWGLRSPQQTCRRENYLSRSAIHHMIRNPFYAGLIIWNGDTYEGAHEPMITIEQHQRLQGLMRRAGKPAPQKHSFPFTGLIRCGECGLMVTAEHKVNRYGSRYTYYHCTKRRRDCHCRQPSISAHALDETFRGMLSKLIVPQDAYRWAFAQLDGATRDRTNQRDQQLRSLERALAEATRSLDNLVVLRVRNLIDDSQFTHQRTSLLAEKASLAQRLRAAKQGDQWFEPARKLLQFSNRAISWYCKGSDQRKRRIVRAVCSNLTLTDKIVSIQARKPFARYAGNPSRSNLLGGLDDVRTLYNAHDKELLDTLAIIDELVKEEGLSLEGEN